MQNNTMNQTTKMTIMSETTNLPVSEIEVPATSVNPISWAIRKFAKNLNLDENAVRQNYFAQTK